MSWQQLNFRLWKCTQHTHSRESYKFQWWQVMKKSRLSCNAWLRLRLTAWLNDLSREIIRWYICIRDHSSITSSKRWEGGVRKWQFLMIYSAVNHQRGGWAYKSQKHDDIKLECPLTNFLFLFEPPFSTASAWYLFMFFSGTENTVQQYLELGTLEQCNIWW